MDSAGKPLEGLKLIDFTRVLAGPYATALLADLGADVIKVESPGGDDYRHIGPFRNGESALFQSVNRGKRSIVLDLKSAADVETARRLVNRSDALVENFRPGTMGKLGLGPESFADTNPRLVYASISGFGQTGPNAIRPAYDIIIQAMSGIMALTGEPEQPPTMVGEAVADVAGGIFSAWAIMVALYERERTGRGRVIDVALFDSLLAMLPTAAARVLVSGQDPVRTGNRHALSAPFGVYPARDGHFAVAVLNDRLFADFCAVLDQPQLLDDNRFKTDELRRRNESDLSVIIDHWASDFTADEVVAKLAAGGVPASVLSTVKAAWQSEQANARQLMSPVRHDLLGELRLPEQPVHFIGSTRGSRKPAPELDQHGEEIRRELEE